MPAMNVFIEPGERGEALEAYKDWLTPEQVAEIENAPESAIIRLQRDFGGVKTKITVIEEG